MTTLINNPTSPTYNIIKNFEFIQKQRKENSIGDDYVKGFTNENYQNYKKIYNLNIKIYRSFLIIILILLLILLLIYTPRGV
jgi:hypothetical protein